jgi:hypothetical protein
MIRAWYIPAWNGDWRLEPDPAAPEERTILTIERPTADEKRLLRALEEEFKRKGWVGAEASQKMREPRSWLRGKATIRASLAEIGPIVASTCKPGPNVLTAVRFKDGRIEVCETSASGVDVAKSLQPYRSPAGAEAALAAPKKDEPKKDEPKKDEPSEESKALAKKKDAEAAATVKRPTPCCPDCFVSDDVNKPATEVLLSFLDAEQHASWRDHRFLIVRGGITGHRYLVAHRNSPIAQQNTRMCYDLDDCGTMHFHDWTVPPEEEALAAMLILRHREAWLRNQATALGGQFRYVMQNPFGGGGDGVRDSILTHQIGEALMGAFGLRAGRRRYWAPGQVATANGWLVNESTYDMSMPYESYEAEEAAYAGYSEDSDSDSYSGEGDTS